MRTHLLWLTTASLLAFGPAACGSSSSSGSGGGDGGTSDSGGSSGGGSSGGGSGSSSGGGSGGGSSGGGSGSSSGGSSGGSSSGGGSGSSGGGSSGGFPAGTICNSSGKTLTPPAKVKNIIAILFENEDYGSVNGSASAAPYIDSLAGKCGVATAYDDNCFTTNLVSSPHYLALTSGSNCDTGLNSSGTGCITDDSDATAHTLTTTSIFAQVSSWKAYQEAMPSACDKSSAGPYATKHNPAAYYSTLGSCAASDLAIPELTCNPKTPMTKCSTPSNAFVNDLTNDTLAAFTFITPSLNNDMHDGTITQADNWVYTYLPLILASKAYLRGDVAVQLLWDEQTTTTSGGATPNVFISPYITAGTTSSTVINHFSMLRAWENALGITTFLGCASGTPPGGTGTCPTGSTADVRAALHW